MEQNYTVEYRQTKDGPFLLTDIIRGFDAAQKEHERLNSLGMFEVLIKIARPEKIKSWKRIKQN